MTQSDKNLQPIWNEFSQQYNFTEAQRTAFERYADLLIEWNQKFNITAITSLKSIIRYHFRDSLAVNKCIDLSKIQYVVDVGSGGGFPGIPLKIAFPHLHLLLIEVNNKKQRFLTEVIEQLGLDNVELYTLDWRTFLRTTEGPTELFCCRASLSPDELCRALKPGCHYKHATIAYWASYDWQASPKSEPFVHATHDYSVGHRKRKIVLFKHKPKTITPTE